MPAPTIRSILVTRSDGSTALVDLSRLPRGWQKAVEGATVRPPAIPTGKVIALRAGDKFPATVPAGYTVLLARGATYDVPVAPKLADGCTVIAADGDGPLPLLWYKTECFDLWNAGDVTLANFAINGEGRPWHFGRDVVKVMGIRIDRIASGSFIEQSTPVNNVIVRGCVQVNPIARYFCYPLGDNWDVYDNVCGPSIGNSADMPGHDTNIESVIRVGNPRVTNTRFRKNKVKSTASNKVAYDLRVCGAGVVVEDGEFSGHISIGEVGSVGSVTVRRMKSLDGSAIKLFRGAGDVTIEDNRAVVELSEPSEGGYYRSVVVKSDQPVHITGNWGGASIGKWKLTAPKVTSYTRSGGWKTLTGADLIRGM
jgi:hypothetical protein